MIEVSVVENEALTVDVAEQQSKEVMVSGEIIRLSKQLPKTEEGEDGLVLRSKDGQWATETVDDKPRENSKKLISSGAVFDEFKQRDAIFESKAQELETISATLVSVTEQSEKQRETLNEVEEQVQNQQSNLKTLNETLTAAMTKDIFNMIYPVGSIYMSVKNVNPGTKFGGTWVAWGAGRVPVGVNASDTSFNTVEKTGGSKNAIIPYHRHAVSAVGIASSGSHRHDNLYGDMPDGTADDKLSYNEKALPSASDGVRGGISAANTDINLYIGSTSSEHTHTVPAHNTNYVGTSGNVTNANLQPYITCYMWKRTA